LRDTATLAGWCAPETCEFADLAHPHEDGVAALQDLADAIGAPAEPKIRLPLHLPEQPDGGI
jgi:acetolactate synthase-1/2/3 large subunit